MSEKSISFSIPISQPNMALILKISVLMGMTAGGSSKSSGDDDKGTSSANSGSQFDGTTLEDLKSAAKKAKKDFGEKYAQEILDNHGVEERTSLMRRIAVVDEDDFGVIAEDLLEGPEGGKKDDDDDGDDGDDGGFGDEGFEEVAEVSVAALKSALQALAKTDRKDLMKIMKKHKCPELSSIKKLDAEGRAKLMQAVSHL